MKKLQITFVLLLLTAISVYALWERRLVTTEQEIALQSLANRYLEAFCHNPRALASVVSENTSLSPNLLTRTTDYLEDLLVQEGSCYGHNKRRLQNEVLGSIYDLADSLVKHGMATEFGVSDFYDCLVGIERSFVDLKDSSRRIFECAELLDIRGFWYNALVYRAPREQPIDVVINPPTPIGPTLPPSDHCFEECYNQCVPVTEPILEPIAPPVPVAPEN